MKRERERERERERAFLVSRWFHIKSRATLETPAISEGGSSRVRKLLRLVHVLTHPLRYARCLKPSFLGLLSVDLFVTSRCTLCCDNCSAIAPIYSKLGKARDADADVLLRSVNRLLNAVDSVVSIGFIGGEPLLYRDLPKLFHELMKSDKVGGIHLTTNGTLLPDEALVPYLRSPRVHVNISDYGAISSKKAELIEFLAKHKIAYTIRACAADGWYDLWRMMSNTAPRGYGADERREMFQRCANAETKAIVGDRLYVCCGVYRWMDLGLRGAENGRDFAILDDDPKATRTGIERLMRQDSPPCCDFCDRRPWGMTKAAVQLTADALDARWAALKKLR